MSIIGTLVLKCSPVHILGFAARISLLQIRYVANPSVVLSYFVNTLQKKPWLRLTLYVHTRARTCTRVFTLELQSPCIIGVQRCLPYYAPRCDDSKFYLHFFYLFYFCILCFTDNIHPLFLPRKYVCVCTLMPHGSMARALVARALVARAGPYRSGKSHLLNNLLPNEQLRAIRPFTVGHTTKWVCFPRRKGERY